MLSFKYTVQVEYVFNMNSLTLKKKEKKNIYIYIIAPFARPTRCDLSLKHTQVYSFVINNTQNDVLGE